MNAYYNIDLVDHSERRDTFLHTSRGIGIRLRPAENRDIGQALPDLARRHRGSNKLVEEIVAPPKKFGRLAAREAVCRSRVKRFVETHSCLKG